MGYGKKYSNEDEGFILERVKDLSKLVIGTKYHLRKIIRQEGNVIFDEVHDIVLDKIENEFLFDKDTGEKYSGFEIFIRRK
jgi:hypothetical protein